MEPTIPNYTDESDCTPLTAEQLAARDAAWPEYAPVCLGESAKIRFDLPGWPVQRDPCSCGSLAGDIRAKMAVAGQTALASRYGMHFCAPDALAQFMDDCRVFLAEMEARNAFSLEMLPVPGVGLVGKFPITQAQWRAVMGENPSHFKGDDLPVESVSWNDCQKLCEKLSALTGREFRLPTSDEWDIALAGQEASLETGWFAENSNDRTHPVGQLEPNVFGLYDMRGNVWEWCEDGEGGWQYLRGGSWSDDHHFARSVFRNFDHPAVRDFNVGCRVVCVVRPSERTHFRSLAAIVEQLEACDYRCEAGALANNTAFIELRAGARDEGCLASAPPCGDCAWCRMFGENE